MSVVESKLAETKIPQLRQTWCNVYLVDINQLAIPPGHMIGQVIHLAHFTPAITRDVRGNKSAPRVTNISQFSTHQHNKERKISGKRRCKQDGQPAYLPAQFLLSNQWPSLLPTLSQLVLASRATRPSIALSNAIFCLQTRGHWPGRMEKCRKWSVTPELTICSLWSISKT